MGDVSSTNLQSLVSTIAIGVFFSLASVLSVLFFLGSAVVAEAQSSMGGRGSHASLAGQGEFGGLCVTGLAQGQVIATTCSVKWKSKDGKTYCFQSEDAKKVFLKNPQEQLKKARAHFASLAPSLLKAKAFTEEEAEDAMMAVINERSKDGIFTFYDPRLGHDLTLKFEKVKLVRGMAGYGWFPNAIFHENDNPQKQYALDFWFKGVGQKLQLMDIRVQKAPFRDGKDFILKTRQPVAWWWLPVSEHPGDAEVTRAWHVIAAIHKHVADNRIDGIYHLKDDKTGKSVPLEFVEIHQPVRRLDKDGRYFACTDFRKAGSKKEFYDIDFWLDRTSGEIKVGSVRIHKVPIQDQENGLWYQEKRYNFKGVKFEIVQ